MEKAEQNKIDLDYLGFALNIPIKTASDSREKVLMDIMLSSEKGRNRQIQLF